MPVRGASDRGAGRVVDAARRRRQTAVRGDGGRQEPLELHAGSDWRAGGHGPAQCARVHAVPGRRPVQLHGNGPVRPHAAGDGRERGRADGTVGQPVRRHGPGAGVQQATVRPRVRQQRDGRAAPGPVGHRVRALRRGARRAVPVQLRVLRGRPVARAAGLRHRHAHGQLPGPRDHRPRVQSRGRVKRHGLAPRARNVWPAVPQRGAHVLRRARQGVQGVRAAHRRPETVRRDCRPDAVLGARQRSLRERRGQPPAPELRQRWRCTFESARELTTSKCVILCISICFNTIADRSSTTAVNNLVPSWLRRLTYTTVLFFGVRCSLHIFSPHTDQRHALSILFVHHIRFSLFRTLNTFFFLNLYQ